MNRIPQQIARDISGRQHKSVWLSNYDRHYRSEYYEDIMADSTYSTWLRIHPYTSCPASNPPPMLLPFLLISFLNVSLFSMSFWSFHERSVLP